ncbi:MAG: BrnT family toxin [Rickettsia endosymbiont of Ecitomorpha arachnoides]|uniref:Toxin n=1 Tax=Rickettsia asembonensis TaxID=1068590 RepID=A0A0C2RA83_9RICK|nr:BrnT family toxin [Rickettsia asembonensis]KIJ89048.1 toxin [Rickettsia asembonensis]MCC8406180.1 BrnT family toxin [Rickettsia endosymbiont of Sceptobius lativentris]MCC8462056.1 BrnT family toxin [Rickettsia endosymbiont of Ecitomorpha arachnoides]
MQKQYYFEFNREKNAVLIQERGVSFEQVITLIEQEDYVLNIQNHPNQDKYPNQKIYIVEIDGYCYLVPCVIKEDKVFLKTIIPSRKATKEYIKAKGKKL